VSTITFGGHMDTLLLSDTPSRRRRRYHSPDFKARLIAACQHPGVSVAAIAQAHQLNANLLRRWLREAERASLPPVASPALPSIPQTFVPVRVEPHLSAEPIRLELGSETLRVAVLWPLSDAEACAQWLRAVLR